jgi:hypothetical protein
MMELLNDWKRNIEYWSFSYEISGTGTLDNLLHWVESRLQLNFQEIGFRSDIALSGSGTQFMQGNDSLIFTYIWFISEYFHHLTVLLLYLQQAS